AQAQFAAFLRNDFRRDKPGWLERPKDEPAPSGQLRFHSSSRLASVWRDWDVSTCDFQTACRLSTSPRPGPIQGTIESFARAHGRQFRLLTADRSAGLQSSGNQIVR